MLADVGCDVLLNVDAGSICRFLPSITMSRDMLSYEPGEMDRYKFNLARVRLFALKHVQNAALRHATGVVFLTNYAAHVIQKSCGKLKNVEIIPHGVGDSFRNKTAIDDSWNNRGVIRLLYVSNVELYKHQWHVIDAISYLRDRGYKLTLKLVGGEASATAEKLVKSAIKKSVDEGDFVSRIEFISHDKIPALLSDSDLFLFASSCENMPVTLIEGMSVGLPIVCSDRGPMPEVLMDGGVYFDPEDARSIADAVERVLCSPDLRSSISSKAKALSLQYNWKRCSDDTFKYIAKVCTETTF